MNQSIFSWYNTTFIWLVFMAWVNIYHLPDPLWGITDHFQDALCLCLKMSPHAKPFYETEFDLYENEPVGETHFYRMVLNNDSLWHKDKLQLWTGLLNNNRYPCSFCCFSHYRFVPCCLSAYRLDAYFNIFSENGVFAIPLHKAVTAQGIPDSDELKKTQKNLKEGTPSISSTTSAGTPEAPDDSPRVRRHSSGSSLSQSSRSSVENSSPNTDNKTSNKDQPLESTSWKSRLIDALTLLSSSASASYLMDKQSMLSPSPPQVPPIVLQAIEHLQSYGMVSL